MCTGPPRCANASKPVSASWRFCRAIARISTPSKRPSPSSRATCGEPRRARVNAWKALSPKAYNALQPKTPATGLPIAASRLVLNDYAYRCKSTSRTGFLPGGLHVSDHLLDFHDQVVLITGGSTGIGRATARAFARQGAKVVVGDISEEGAATVELLKSEGGDGL